MLGSQNAVLSSLKSSGFLVYKYFEGMFFKLIRGDKKFEGLKVGPNATKTCLLAGLLFTLEAAEVVRVDPDLLMQSVIVLALTLRVSSLILGTPDPDPYLPLENATCNLVFGQCPSDGDTAAEANNSNKTEDKKPDKKVSPLFHTWTNIPKLLCKGTQVSTKFLIGI